MNRELPDLSKLDAFEIDLLADLVAEKIDTGWADPEWATDDDLRALVRKLGGDA